MPDVSVGTGNFLYYGPYPCNSCKFFLGPLFHLCLLQQLDRTSFQKFPMRPELCSLQGISECSLQCRRIKQFPNLHVLGNCSIQLDTKILNLKRLSTDLLISLTLRFRIVSSDSAPSDETEMDLLETALLECWRVPRTQANSFPYWVNDTSHICNSNALAIDALL